jgi:hypothetical protein
MVYFGMLRRVALIGIDVSEELSASFIRVTRIDELGTTPAVTSNRRTLRRNANIPQDTILHSHRRENLKSYNISFSSMICDFPNYVPSFCQGIWTGLLNDLYPYEHLLQIQSLKLVD